MHNDEDSGPKFKDVTEIFKNDGILSDHILSLHLIHRLSDDIHHKQQMIKRESKKKRKKSRFYTKCTLMFICH